MAKVVFKSYDQNDYLLFPPRPGDFIAENDPVRVLNAVVDHLDIRAIEDSYEGGGASSHHPRMLVKVVSYAYLQNVHSGREMEHLLKRDVNFMWLSGMQMPDFNTIDLFRKNCLAPVVDNLFTQVVEMLVENKFVSLEVQYIDGTKIEANANKYTFVWKKATKTNRDKLDRKVKAILSEAERQLNIELGEENGEVMTSAEMRKRTERILEKMDETGISDKPLRKAVDDVMGKSVPKMKGYEDKLDILGERNSYSKTDHDASFMRMKEDAMNNGQTKPGYNIQISTENQFITHYSSSWRPTDFGTLIPHLDAFERRYNRQSAKVCADSGYGNEQNYGYMEANGIEGFVKYNMFHAEQKRESVNNPFLPEHMFYNADGDYHVCPMGQHLEHSSDSKKKTDLGYEYTTSTYVAQDCSRCPLRGSCHRAKSDRRAIEVNHRNNELKARARERLMSEGGLKHRSKRPVEPEAVFGQIKYDGGFRRFHYRSKELVEAEFATIATAHNIREMASVINAERSRQAAVTSRKACPPSDTSEGGARRIQVIAQR